MAELMLEQRAVSTSLFCIYWKNSILSKQSQKIASYDLSILHATLNDRKGYSHASCSAWQFIFFSP